jgi:hypothetical protein
VNRFGCIPGDRRRSDKPRLDNQMKLNRLEVKVGWGEGPNRSIVWARRLHLLVCAMQLQLVFPRVPPLSPISSPLCTDSRSSLWPSWSSLLPSYRPCSPVRPTGTVLGAGIPLFPLLGATSQSARSRRPRLPRRKQSVRLPLTPYQSGTLFPRLNH